MKKLVLALCFVMGSLFTMAAQNTSANELAVQKETATQSLQPAPAAFGHWEIICIYNPATGMFELHMIWVEDDI